MTKRKEIRVGSKVKIISCSNKQWEGRTGIIDWIPFYKTSFKVRPAQELHEMTAYNALTGRLDAAHYVTLYSYQMKLLRQ